MATPRRRSARLRGGTPACKAMTPDTSTLDALLERQATPEKGGRSISTVIEHPIAYKRVPGAFVNEEIYLTPKHTLKPKPATGEMHPSLAHHNTIKVSNADLQLGFSDINPYQSSPLRPNNSTATTEPIVFGAHTMSSPTFDFKFHTGNNDLSEEAERIMKSVRDEAARIKEKMKQERDEQARKDQEVIDIGDVHHRRFAKPKGRFSDAHKAEFSKMDSIASHASTWKTKEPRSFASPANVSPTKPTIVLEVPSGKRPQPVKRTLDFEQEASPSPAKRIRTAINQDVSAIRPTSTSSQIGVPSPRKGGLPSAVTTPTKASLGRAHSVKSSHKPTAPTSGLPRAKSVVDLTQARGPMRYGSASRLTSAFARRVGSLKSILHRPQLRYSNNPHKIAAGTHVPPPEATPSISEGIPEQPGAPHAQHMASKPMSSTPKKVEFSSSTKDDSEAPAPPTPSPTKIPSLAPTARVLGYVPGSPSISPSRPRSQCHSLLQPHVASTTSISYPSLASPSPSRLAPPSTVSCQPSPSLRRQIMTAAVPNTGVFTFSSDNPKRFGPGTSSGSSIRQVRPSGMPTPILAVPHGLETKKRARAMAEDSDLENVDPKDDAKQQEERGEDASTSSPNKRRKGMMGVKIGAKVEEVTSEGAAARKRRQTGFGGRKTGGAVASAGGEKKGLSLARINFLARPKQRGR